MDNFAGEKRSRIMAAIKGRNTTPELKVRSLLHRLGFRFRVTRKDLPGKPDIVLPKHKKIIFVNGCFWHGHEGCKRAKRPETNSDFWNKKIDGNITRDRQTRTRLGTLGWKTLTVWECELKNKKKLEDNLLGFVLEKGALDERPRPD